MTAHKVNQAEELVAVNGELVLQRNQALDTAAIKGAHLNLLSKEVERLNSLLKDKDAELEKLKAEILENYTEENALDVD